MTARERQNAIERELRLSGTVRVQELARRLDASVVSIRRDLNVLADRGVVRRIHGGAVPAAEDHQAPPATRSMPAARDAQQRVLPLIGIVVPASTYYYADVIGGAEQMAKDLGVRLVLAVSGYSGAEERHQIARLLELGAKGLLVTPTAHALDDRATYDALAGLSLPVVIMERNIEQIGSLAGLDVVHSDHALGAREALDHLSNQGHRGVVLVANKESPTTRGLLEGFERARTRFADGRTKALLVRGSSEYSAELRADLDAALDTCLSLGATSALVHSDVTAVALAQIARDRGLRIPDDLAIIAYDDVVAALAHPPLDAVAPPKREVGRVAVRLCKERISAAGAISATARSRQAPVNIAIVPELVLRGSSEKPTVIA